MKNYDKFIYKYKVREINTEEEHDFMDMHSYGYNYNHLTKQTYYSPRSIRTEICTIKIERHWLDTLIENDIRFEEFVLEQRKEEYVRYTKPAVKAAYDKYKLLFSNVERLI